MVAAAGQLVPFVLHVQRLGLADISCIHPSWLLSPPELPQLSRFNLRAVLKL